MDKKSSEALICGGNINTGRIYETHRQIKVIVDSYKEVNLKVNDITAELRDNWVGAGRNEFESQYNILIRKIEDFGDILQEIYNALVNAEASYEDADDDIRQDFVMAMK